MKHSIGASFYPLTAYLAEFLPAGEYGCPKLVADMGDGFCLAAGWKKFLLA
ncbi:hypothetical protein [Pseudomonas akapageensis]|uniref:hypothetical protein n=1 Tax=Pseudomonas akapageensis TaxID=2609961 RepID=UPI00140ADEE0|nr:hypothetical protein [Pseudomonas akapageensis]